MDLPVLLAYGSALFAISLAVTVCWQERTVAHWAFAAGLIALAAESCFFGLALDTLDPGVARSWLSWSLTASSFLPATWLGFSLSYARGNHREFLKKWRFALMAALAIPAGLALIFQDGLFRIDPLTPARSGLNAGLTVPGLLIHLSILLGSILVLMNLERTFRAAIGTMQWRIKFMILGVGILFAVRAYSSSQTLLFRSVNPSLQQVNAAVLLLACLLIVRSLMRAGHFRVSVYPSQSVLQNSLTVMLAGIYLLVVGLLAKLVAFLGGDASFTVKSFFVLVSLVLLTVLLMSDRVRLATRRLVSRHFARPIHDYRAVWRSFTEATARRVEQQDLCTEVARLISRIFQALSVTVWLLDERKEALLFAASTSLLDSQAGRLRLDAADAGLVIQALAAHPEPVDLDRCKEAWASALRRLHPDEFRNGGNRVCVPLIAGGEVLGLILVGDRVAGIPLSVQDFDLLRAASDQAAASLLNIQLSQRLAQAKQLEAFQAMSAFFVHDLKNTASTLSLMLKNLPVHFNDPAFREDALRGISKSVEHINELIARLTQLRKELTVHSRETDLNRLVVESLEAIGGLPQVQVTKDLQSLPPLMLDPAQIQNVFTNILFNARDALGSEGKIQIATGRRNGWAVVSVADNGCGMSREFLERSLFRPFQTTKQRGIGIGMFQCKMIVEAHRGRIEVESEAGKGTTFRVLLPFNS